MCSFTNTERSNVYYLAAEIGCDGSTSLDELFHLIRSLLWIKITRKAFTRKCELTVDLYYTRNACLHSISSGITEKIKWRGKPPLPSGEANITNRALIYIRLQGTHAVYSDTGWNRKLKYVRILAILVDVILKYSMHNSGHFAGLNFPERYEEQPSSLSIGKYLR